MLSRAMLRQLPARDAHRCHGCSSNTRRAAGNSWSAPICFNARKLDEGAMVANASIAGATPMFEWLGDDDAAIFSY